MTNETRSEERKDEVELTLGLVSKLGEVQRAEKAGNYVNAAIASFESLAKTINLLTYRISHPFGTLEKQIDFPSGLRSEISGSEGENAVKYVLEVTDLRLFSDKHYGIKGMPEFHPVVYGDFELKKYRVESVKEKIKKPIRVTKTKKKWFGRKKVFEEIEFVEEEVNIGKTKEVEVLSAQTANSVFMRVPDFKSDLKPNRPYLGSTRDNILCEIEYQIAYRGLAAKTRDEVAEVLNNLLHPIENTVAIKFREAKSILEVKEKQK